MVATSRSARRALPRTARRAPRARPHRQTLEAEQHRGAHRVRAQRGHAAALASWARSPLAHLAHELLKQEGIAARCVMTGRRELRVRRAEQRLHALSAPSGESAPGRIETVAGSARISASGTRELADLRGPHRQKQDHRQVGDPEAEEALGSHRRRRRPTGRRRSRSAAALAGEVRGEPVQAVQALVHQLWAVGVLGAAGIQDRKREPRGPGEQRRRAPPGSCRERPSRPSVARCRTDSCAPAR